MPIVIVRPFPTKQIKYLRNLDIFMKTNLDLLT
jgi:hypothetical protein